MDALSGTLILFEDIVVTPGLQSSRGTTGSSWMALESGGLFAPR